MSNLNRVLLEFEAIHWSVVKIDVLMEFLKFWLGPRLAAAFSEVLPAQLSKIFSQLSSAQLFFSKFATLHQLR